MYETHRVAAAALDLANAHPAAGHKLAALVQYLHGTDHIHLLSTCVTALTPLELVQLLH